MKGKLFILLGSITAALTIGSAINVKDAISTNAEQVKSTVVNDNFNVTKYRNTINPEKWVDFSDNALRQADPYEKGYLTAYSNFAGGDYVAFGTKEKIANISSIQFKFKLSNTSNRWFTFHSCVDPVLNNHKYNSSLVYEDGYLLTRNYIFEFVDLACNPSPTFDYASKLGAGVNAADYWMNVKVDIIDEMNAYLNCSISDTFDDANKVNINAFDSELFNFRNGYVTFFASSDNGEYCLKDIVIKNDAGDEIKSDFTNSETFDFNYGDDNFVFYRGEDTSSVGRTTNIFNPTNLVFKGADADQFVSSKLTIAKDKTVAKDVSVVEVSLTAKISGNDKIGIVFGVDNEVSQSIDSNVVVYEISKDGGVLKEYDDDGNQILPSEYNSNVFSSTISSETGSTLTINIKKNGAITIKENDVEVKDNLGEKVEFSSVSNYDGSFAVASLGEIDENSSSFVDDIVVKNGKYYVPVTKSVTHNFSNDFIGNEGYEDFYIRNVSGAGDISINEDEGRLVYNMCTDGSFFGSAHQYDAFILDFKLMNIKVDFDNSSSKEGCSPNKWIGLDLSRQTKTKTEYGSSLMAAVVVNPYDTEKGSVPEYTSAWLYTDSTSPTTVDLSTVKTNKVNDIPTSLFTTIQYENDSDKYSISEEDAICFRYISDGTNLTLQLKKACEKEFTTYYIWSNMELSGYFALACTGWSFWEIDDFSMANTSTIYECADNYEPETQVITETVVVYDTGAVDVNLSEEITLHKSNNPVNLVIVIVCSVVSVAAIGFGVFTIVRGKKKHEK